MFTTEQFLNGIKHEVGVLKHLYSKVPKDKLEYRPTPKQRSLRELLEYIPVTLAVVQPLLKADWSNFKDVVGPVKEAARKDFCAALDNELNKFVEAVQAIPEADFQNKKTKLPTGAEAILGDALLGFPYKFLAAYKLQLFLYLKACGREELNTANCWFGVDMQMPGRK